MAKTLQRGAALIAKLNEAGLPVTGFSSVDLTATPVTVELTWPEGYVPTIEQLGVAQGIIDQHSWSGMRPLNRNAVASQVLQLSTAHQALVRAHQTAAYLIQNPIVAAQLNAALGINLAVEEEDPT